jgi:nitrate reductase NapE component
MSKIKTPLIALTIMMLIATGVVNAFIGFIIWIKDAILG